jgi:VIT1/CCC1 family predicted Fe2+/Mn2+ transporter
VSVSSQRDAEQADIETEKKELKEEPADELQELAAIYEGRGLDKALAMQVAQQLTAKDPLTAHLRDELGVDPKELSQPLQAAWISAVSFALFALVPICAHLLAPDAWRVPVIAGASLLSLGTLGALGGYLGGANRFRAALRVCTGGGLAMLITALVGRLFQ